MHDEAPPTNPVVPASIPPARSAPAESSTITWQDKDQTFSAPWRSDNNWAPPKRTMAADDTMTADTAYRFASEGVGLIWTGDFQNARQLLQALGRRTAKRRIKYAEMPYPERFHQVRLARAQRARTLGMLLLRVEPHHVLKQRRAPDVAPACLAAYGDDKNGYVVPMSELLGVISAYEWRKKGVEIPALQAHIHPHYGVFAPVRTEYIDLLLRASLSTDVQLAFDVGTGTGVLAALLVQRGVPLVVATDANPKAIACARDNIRLLKRENQIKLRATDLYPDGRADLIVCNPPWLPGKPASALEHAVYRPALRIAVHQLDG